MSLSEDTIEGLSEEISKISICQPHGAYLLAQAHLKRGDLYRKHRRFAEAVEDYDAARALFPETEKDLKTEAAVKAALATLEGGEWISGTLDLAYTYEKNPEAVCIALAGEKSEVGELLYQLYDGVLGLRVFSELLATIKKAPETARALFSAGPVLEEALNQLLLAVADYECGDQDRALSWVALLVEAELTHAEQDRWGIESYLTSLAFEDKHPVGLYGMGYYWYMKDAILAAVEVYEKMHEAYPDLHPWTQRGIRQALQRAPEAIKKHIQDGEFAKAASLAKRLGDHVRAAKWYEQFAKELEEKGENESAPDNYQAAAECYENAGEHERAAMCWRHVHRLRQEPDLQVVVNTPETLVLREWESLSISITNAGFGPAHDLRIQVQGPVTAHDPVQIQGIAADAQTTVEIAVRPNEAGRRVPITVQITYHDKAGSHELAPITKLVTVTRP